MSHTFRLLIHAALAALLGLLLLPAQAHAKLTLKVATLAPEGTTWYKALRRVGDEWETLTGGEIEVKIYAGGVVGNETVALRKMRLGQLHGAAITGLSLIEMDERALVITNTPMLIRDYDELDYVMGHMAPTFEAKAEEMGFKIVAWSEAGWGRLFTAEAMTKPEELGNFKWFAWEGDPHAVEMYREVGMSPVVVASTDVVPSLQSGLFNAYPNTPLGALSLQWFAFTPHMMDVGWAPLIACTVVSTDAWAAVPEQYHAPMIEAAQRVSDEVKLEIRRQDAKAVEVMKRYGLQVHEVDDETLVRWHETAESTYPIIRDKVVGAETFDEVVRLLEEYRASH